MSEYEPNTVQLLGGAIRIKATLNPLSLSPISSSSLVTTSSFVYSNTIALNLLTDEMLSVKLLKLLRVLAVTVHFWYEGALSLIEAAKRSAEEFPINKYLQLISPFMIMIELFFIYDCAVHDRIFYLGLWIFNFMVHIMLLLLSTVKVIKFDSERLRNNTIIQAEMTLIDYPAA
jgi:hypothetical protein